MKSDNLFGTACPHNVLPVCNWQGGVGVKRREEYSKACGQSDVSAGYKPAARWALVVALVCAVHLHAADVLTEKLQRGLFEEEANHNLDAAIKEYQAVVTLSDEQRKVTATALFRLGECYRKLGKTNEATAFYQRITRDFSEQEQLAKLANDFLKPVVSPPVTGNKSLLVQELERKHAILKVESISQRMEADRLASLSRDDLLNTDVVQKDAGYLNLLQEGAVISQKSTDLKAKQLAEGHPEVQALNDLRKKLIQQVGERLNAIVASAQERARSTAVQVIVLGDELKKAQNETGVVTSPAPGTASLTQAEAEELARVKTLAKNSPDLLQSSGTDGLSQLQLAARDGHYSVVEFILAQGVNANGPERSVPPLKLAAERGHLRIVQLLLDQGADVNGADSSGWTALMSACQNGFRSVAELLLARGADVNRASKRDSTALHLAVWKGQTGIAELLLQRGANPNVLARSAEMGWPTYSANGATPLHLAVSAGVNSLVELLLKSGASASATNYARRTPLHLAATAGNKNLSALLLDQGANPNVPDGEAYTPLNRAIETGHPEIVTLLLAKGADVNQATTNANGSFYYPVHAALSKNLAVLEALLVAKPNLEVVNGNGQTPLIYALSLSGDPSEQVDRLLNAGADANHAANGVVPILAATEKRNLQMVTALLKHGANPNVITQADQTPLSYVQNVLKGGPRNSENARIFASFEQIEKALREQGANENLRRLKAITFTRPTWTADDSKVFYRGTNDYNGHTLFEFLANVFSSQNAPAFPDLARVTLERIEGTNAKPRELTLNIDEMVRSGQCSKDVRLEWGDRLSFPELDHPLNESWSGISQAMRDLLTRCLTRRVEIIVKQETNVVKLVENMSKQSGFPGRFMGLPPMIPGQPVGVPVSPAIATASPQEKPAKVLPTFRLKEVVYGANVLRASSDPTRVRVMRREGDKTNEWVIDLTRVATSGEWNSPGSSQQSKLWPQHDLWLRDGDVIEVPEKP